MMPIYIFVGAGIAFTALGYYLARTTLTIAGAFSWLLFALHCYSLSTTAWDIYFFGFWFGIGLMLTIAIEAVVMKTGIGISKDIPKGNEDMTPQDRAERGYYEDEDNHTKINQVRRKHGLSKKKESYW